MIPLHTVGAVVEDLRDGSLRVDVALVGGVLIVLNHLRKGTGHNGGGKLGGAEVNTIHGCHAPSLLRLLTLCLQALHQGALHV